MLAGRMMIRAIRMIINDALAVGALRRALMRVCSGMKTLAMTAAQKME